jgi:hypothetical protein
VIGGGWSSHEETHVWQARIFGSLYMPAYLISLLLALLARLCTGKLASLTFEAYRRICFEDWAYSAGSASGAEVKWGGWLLWFALSSVFVALILTAAIGFASGAFLLAIAGCVGMLLFSVVRALTPA